jgi:hypothetical protein
MNTPELKIPDIKVDWAQLKLAPFDLRIHSNGTRSRLQNPVYVLLKSFSGMAVSASIKNWYPGWRPIKYRKVPQK